MDLRAAPDGVGRRSPTSRIAGTTVTRLALAATTPVPGRVARLHVRGARITGALLLRHGTVQVPVLFEDCLFDEPLDLSHARAKSLSLRGSDLRKLMNGTGSDVLFLVGNNSEKSA